MSITLSPIRDALHRGGRHQFSECDLVLVPPMLDSRGFQVSKDAWIQILLESAEDSIVPLAAQCEQIDSSIAQLRREKERLRHWQERCKNKDGMIRKLRMMRPTRGCGSLPGSGFDFLEVFRWLCEGLLVGLPHGRWGLRRAKTSQRILY